MAPSPELDPAVQGRQAWVSITDSVFFFQGLHRDAAALTPDAGPEIVRGRKAGKD